MTSNKIAFIKVKSNINTYLETLKRSFSYKNRPLKLSDIFEKLSLSEAILEEEATSKNPEALLGAMELFSNVLNKLLNLSPEGFAHLIDVWIKENKEAASKNEINSRKLAFLHINEALSLPFFDALDTSTKNEQNSNSQEIIGHYLWDCFKLYLMPNTITTLDQILEYPNQSTFLKYLISTQKRNFHKLREESKTFFSSRYISFYNSCFFVTRDASLETMAYLSDLLFFIVESQLDNKTTPKDLARYLPNMVFNHHEGQLDYLVLCTADSLVASELKNLTGKADTLYNFDDMTQWQNTLDSLISKHEINLAECEKTYHFQTRNYATDSYRYNALKCIVFKIECFYFAHKNYSAIAQLWHARDDYGNAGVMYTGGSIHPETIDELLLMYWFFIYPNVIDETFYFGNPMSHVPVAKEYFIFLLLRVLEKANSFHFRKIKAVETYKLRNFLHSWNKEQRISLKVPIEAVKNNSSALKELFPNTAKNSLNIEDQDNVKIQKTEIKNNDEELFKKLDHFLQSLSEQCQIEIHKREENAPLSQNKIQEMKEEFWQGYHKQNGLLQEYLQPSFCKLEAHPDGTSTSFGIYAFFPRDQFIDGTNIFADNTGMGWQIALGENSKLFKILAINCTPELSENWISALNGMVKNQKEPIVFVTVRGRYDFMESQQQIGVDIISGNIFIKSDNERKPIEIHQIMMTPDDRQDKTIPFMLILEKDMIGALVYSNPLKKDDSLDDLFEHFKIEVTDARSKFKELEEANPSEEFYLALGETPEQREAYLKKQVILEITERFELETPEAFTGYAFYWE